MSAPVFAYLALVNVLSFFAYGGDKLRARTRGARRTPEKTLLLLAAVGGSLGALIGMRLFRHKTRHRYFACGVPAMLIVHIALLAWAYAR